ncbi:MAG TPA: glycosyltransferase family 4 protein [Pyrinomonadaceae bacterium]|nr:glycosyltransferase family 4 protein [Pyrinomonadaceae bacterium]
MRVLQLSSSKHYGGGERHFVDLCRGLQDRGHEVFAALRPTNVWQERLSFLPNERIFHVSIRNSFGILSATRIAGFARDNGIEIIHAHVARDYIPASIACALAGPAKFVLTRHVLFPLKPFNKFALNNLSKAIAVSSGVERTLKSVFPESKIVHIPNGIDPNPMDDAERERLRSEFRSSHGVPIDVPLIATIGELIPLKGQQDLVLAANEVLRKRPEVCFLIVGKDNTVDQRHRRDLKRLVKVLGHEERFLWLDWVDDTRPLFAAMDVFVSASHTESFGMAILEALAMGTPVVATSTEGAKELISDAENLVPIGNPVKLAETIMVRLNDMPRSRMIAERARATAQNQFSLDRMIDETVRLYGTL